MSADSERQQTIDRLVASVRETAEASLRSYAEAVADAATEEIKKDAAARVAHLRDTIQRLELTRIDVESQLAESVRFLDEARRTAADDIAAVEAKYAAALADAAELRRAQEEATGAADTALAAERRRADAAVADLHAMRQARATAGAARIRSLRTLDEAGSLGVALGRLLDLAAEQAERAALLLVRNDTLALWRTAGFDSSSGPDAPDAAGNGSDVLRIAWREARCVVQRAGDDRAAPLPPFATTGRPRDVVACPVPIGREVIAVLFADAAPGDAETVPEWCHAVEILARYTGRVLESLTIRLALDARTAHPSAGAPSGSSLFSGGIR